ncbi:AmmeMemoRadiSam system protein B [Gulosibacter macacae]|uniref:MEMO1 family protein EG850_11695 n=1 Tax=Gulosibacter macacae TaxID=2488791 RepID=A0A3P3VYR2_9MICO|nr:AmmeMemoRadiSam system protein B [Gulosibacter macacae]RRJ85813.1 AmmeMemoRadiSam system protein B [Gulosibacter macacae]
MTVRSPAVAGLFYPADAAELSASVDRMLAEASVPDVAPGVPLRALVVPHAGHRFSGPTAATGYVQLDIGSVRTVVLLGPTHRVGIRGIADAGFDAFNTPLGDVRVDRDLVARALTHPAVITAPRVHAEEHSLEVHLPFLQRQLGDFALVPLAVGDVPPATVAEVIALFDGDPQTVILVSSDLSHFEAYESARAHDAETLQRIVALDATLQPTDACGVRPLNGLLTRARAKHWQPSLVSACNSGDTPDGDLRRVVGYATVAFHAPPASSD